MLLVYALKVLLYKDGRLSIVRFDTDFITRRPMPPLTLRDNDSEVSVLK